MCSCSGSVSNILCLPWCLFCREKGVDKKVRHHLPLLPCAACCRDAVKQIDDRRYAAEFVKGYRTVICYGIAFCNKECVVLKLG